MPITARLLYTAFASLVMLNTSPDAIKLQDLTVANEQLPKGCALAASPTVRLSEKRVLGGLWAGLPIDSNPWIGTDRNVLARIREHMYGPPRLPDAPPNAKAAAAYARHLVDNVSAGYAAFYQDVGPDGIAIYALTFTSDEPLRDPSTAPPKNPPTSDTRLVSWITLDKTVVLVVGDRGHCADVIQTKVQSLARKN
jgi:hypothetical protein